MIRVIVNGANGKMGKETVAAIQQASDLELVGTAGRGDNLAAMITDNAADVVVDFSSVDSVYETALSILDSQARPVIGTSGLQPQHIATLTAQCETKKKGAIIAPNFCIGAVLMMKYAADAARYFEHVEIIELHHDQKKDSPSGTAMKTAEMIQASATKTLDVASCKEIISGSRGANSHGIAVHAVRLPGLVAHQEVIFGDVGQTLTIRHDSIDRRSFMPGVCLACREVMQLDHLVYGLEHLL